MRIFVVIPEQSDLEVRCRPTDTVSIVKDKIFNAHGLFANFYKLSYENVTLDNNMKMLQEYGIVNGSVLKLIHWNDPLEVTGKKFFRLKSD